MAKASINFAKASSGGLKHNDRTEEKEPEYLLPVEHRLKNEVNVSAKFADEKIKDLYSRAKENYQDKFGQKLQAKSYTWEAVINLNKEHTLEDVERLTKEIEKETGFTSVQIAIHRDEGRMERGTPIYNLHAHVTFFTLDQNTGQQLYRKSITPKQKEQQPNLKPMNRERLSKLQDLTAKALGMERGKKGSKAQRLDHKQYKAVKQAELAKVKDLKEEIKELRAELKAQGAGREDYAKLEALNKELKEQVKAKDLTISDLKKEVNSWKHKAMNWQEAKTYQELYEDTKKENLELKEQNKALEAKISTKEYQSMPKEEKTALNPSKIDLSDIIETLKSSVNYPRDVEYLYREYTSDEIIKSLFDDKGRISEVKRGANKLGLGGEKVKVVEFDFKDFEEAYTKVKERESKIKKILTVGKDLVNRFRENVLQIKKALEPKKEKAPVREKNQSKNQGMRRG
jgi:hypothetical protein